MKSLNASPRDMSPIQCSLLIPFSSSVDSLRQVVNTSLLRTAVTSLHNMGNLTYKICNSETDSVTRNIHVLKPLDTSSLTSQLERVATEIETKRGESIPQEDQCFGILESDRSSLIPSEGINNQSDCSSLSSAPETLHEAVLYTPDGDERYGVLSTESLTIFRSKFSILFSEEPLETIEFTGDLQLVQRSQSFALELTNQYEAEDSAPQHFRCANSLPILTPRRNKFSSPSISPFPLFSEFHYRFVLKTEAAQTAWASALVTVQGINFTKEFK